MAPPLLFEERGTSHSRAVMGVLQLISMLYVGVTPGAPRGRLTHPGEDRPFPFSPTLFLWALDVSTYPVRTVTLHRPRDVTPCHICAGCLNIGSADLFSFLFGEEKELPFICLGMTRLLTMMVPWPPSSCTINPGELWSNRAAGHPCRCKNKWCTCTAGWKKWSQRV